MSDGEIDRNWAFDVGDRVAQETSEFNNMPGGGIADLASGWDYEIRRRLVDEDTGEKMYHVENTEGNTQLFKSSTIRVSHEKVGEADDDE